MLSINWLDSLTAIGSSYALIFAAEIGDKSQLVCMTLAARYRHLPVMLGAVFAFIVLNTLAVIFGATIANLVPEILVAAAVALLFAVFGFHAFSVEEESEEEVEVKSGRNIFIATFLLITVAEFGDKTQLAVVGLSSTIEPGAIWLGSTLALVTTSFLGIWAGRTVLQRIPIVRLHQISGLFFILLAVLAAYQVFRLW